MEKKKWPLLASLIAATEATGFISFLASGGKQALAHQYAKPPFSPPDQVFGIVWPILYLLMAVAFYLVLVSGANKEHIKLCSWLFWAQMFFNFLWSIIFFRFHLYWAAAVDLVILDLLVLLTMMCFRKIDKRSFWLMLPYFIWILFATYLNIGVAILN